MPVMIVVEGMVSGKQRKLQFRKDDEPDGGDDGT
jgi:hypothetical protein